MSDDLLRGYPTNPILGTADKYLNGGIAKKVTDTVTGGYINKMAGGSEMGVIETVFAEVLARLIIIVILLALAYYGFMFVYEEYLKDFIQSFKNIMGSVVDILKKIVELLGGTLGVAGGALGAATNTAKKVPGVNQALDALKNIF